MLAYNPTGLTTLDAPRASFMHTAHFLDTAREHVAVALPGLGITIDSLSYGSLRRRTLSNPDGAGLGTFSPSALSAAVGFAFPVTDAASIGAAVRHTRETIDGTTGAAFSADVGGQAVLSEDPLLRAGLAVQNAGPPTRFDSATEKLPLNVRWGLAAGFGLLDHPFVLLADANHDDEGRLVMQAGLTTPVSELVTLRVGYNGRNDAGLGLTAGFGVAWGKLSMDYAVAPYGALGLAHQLSLGYAFGRPEPASAFPPPRARK